MLKNDVKLHVCDFIDECLDDYPLKKDFSLVDIFDMMRERLFGWAMAYRQLILTNIDISDILAYGCNYLMDYLKNRKKTLNCMDVDKYE